jgi:AcrR family transcriptional regulator
MSRGKYQTLCRKQPVQARSKASVVAILDATVQILSTRRTIRLTTKAIAARAGLSIGSLYQYFPNKQAIVLVLIARKAEEVTSAFEDAARKQHGRTLANALNALTSTYFTEKFSEPLLSKTLHAALDRSGGAQILRPFRERMVRAIESVLRQAPDAVFRNVQSTARMIWSAITGGGRSMLEAERSQPHGRAVQREVQQMILAYIKPMMLSISTPTTQI